MSLRVDEAAASRGGVALVTAARPGSIRVEADGFEASEEDIAAVCLSAIRELQRHCPALPTEDVVIEHGGGEGHAIVLHERNNHGEVVIRLDTGKTFWSQYAYQTAHEMCHIHCSFRYGPIQNQWFEETICETASLFCLRAMAHTWKTEPPYPHWADYAPFLLKYTDDVISKRIYKAELLSKGLPQFYRDHETELRANACGRELNGTIALALLPYLEEKPKRWATFHWLNATERPESEPFADYLTRWEQNTPEEYKATVQGVRGLFGLAPAMALSGSVRIDAVGFEAAHEDITAVCLSAIGELQRHSPELPAEKVVIRHGPQVVTLFERNNDGDVVIQLSTRNTFWCQYAYQITQQYATVHCGFRCGPMQNQWFEQAVCETASLFCLRGMARTWKTEPPYPHWRSYASALAEYADGVTSKCTYKVEFMSKGLAHFYRDHEAELRAANADRRDLTGAIALALLPFLEEAPHRWTAFRWLNATACPENEPFADYLTRWRDNTPEKHKGTVQGVRQLFGLWTNNWPCPSVVSQECVRRAAESRD